MVAQKQYKFSLSVHDKHNKQVKQIVEGLLQKGNGALSQSIRDGLRLLNDLRRGRVKVLLEMFPDIVDQLCPKEPPPDNGDIDQRITHAVEIGVKTALENYIPPQSNGLPLMSSLQPANQGAPRQIGGGIDIAMPVIEDDEVVEGETVEVKVSHEGGNISAMAAKVWDMMQVDTNSQEYRNIDTGRRH